MTATSTSWKRESFTEGVPLPFNAIFNDQEIARLGDGVVPERMEDKWFIYYEAPHLFFHRSWTGQPVYRLELQSTSSGAKVVEALWAKTLANAEGADPTYQAKLLDFLICNLLLGQSKPFPGPEGNKGANAGHVSASCSGH